MINKIQAIQCVICLLLVSSEVYCGGWPNEPAGSTVTLDCPFNDRTCGGAIWDVYNSATPPASLPDAPFSPSNVFHDVLVYPNTTGGSQMDYIVGGRQTPLQNQELYVGFWWRTNPEFSGNGVGSNKLFFIKDANASTNGVFMYRLPQSGEKVGFLFWAPQQFENGDQCADGGLTCLPNVASVPVRPGIWYRIEAYIRASSCYTCHDGIVRWWVNGQLAGDYRKYAYSGPVNVWEWTETWDGDVGSNGKGFTADAHHYIDHLRVSVPNCGPAGCPVASYVVITSTIPPARTGNPYLATLTANGGTVPYTWFLESGNLPAGLTLNPKTGVISGTPTCAGRSDFTLRVTDAGTPAVSTTKPFSVITSGTPCAAEIEISKESAVNAPRLTAEQGATGVRFQMQGAGTFSLAVYDLAGREVWKHSGSEEAVWNPGGVLRRGVYFVRAEQNGNHLFAKFNNLR